MLALHKTGAAEIPSSHEPSALLQDYSAAKLLTAQENNSNLVAIDGTKVSLHPSFSDLFPSVSDFELQKT